MYLVYLLIMLSNILYAQNLESLKPLSENLKGKVEFSWLWFDVYTAKLWSSHSGDIFEKPFSLELIYKRNLSGKDIAEQSVKEMVKQGVDKNFAKSYQKKMEELFPDVKSKDILMANYDPIKGLTIVYNRKKVTGVVSDLKFAKSFLNIWLGPKVKKRKLRKQLLGL